MDRRFAHLSALIVAVLGVMSADLALAATQCGIDSAAYANGDKLAPMATVVSSATTRPAEETAARSKDKTTAPAALANAGGSSNPTTAGGGIAAGSGEEGVLGDGGTPAGTHKRGLRWQSFLPGMIR